MDTASSEDDHLHWVIHVSCAILGTAGVGMVVVSDVADARDLGRWGILASLAAAVAACIIVADRYSARICRAAHREVEDAVEDLSEQIDVKAAAVIATYADETETIAESVCQAVVRAIGSQRPRSVKG